MAVTLLKNITKYAGTAAERAAMDVSNVKVGDTFFEWDTSKLYIYSGTAWVEKNGTVQIDNIAAGATVIGKVIPADTDGDEKFTAANPAVMQLSGSSLTDTQAIPIQPISKLVKLANAVAITDATAHTYDLQIISGLTYEQIRKYRRFRITFYNTHNKAATVHVAETYPARSEGYSSIVLGTIYTETNILAATSGYLSIQGLAGGTGVVDYIKAVPVLQNTVLSNLIIAVTFAEAPTTGALSIAIEMGV